MKKQKILLITLFLAFNSMLSFAQIPSTLSYQGVLTDSLGNSKPDGMYSFIFSLYDKDTEGTPLWQEKKDLQVKRGLFSTMLGDLEPFGSSITFTKQYWLSIKVDADIEMPQRIPLTAVGYSLNSVKADTAQYAKSAPSQGFVDSARIASTIADNSITSSKIVNGTIQFADIAQNGAASGQVMKWNGSAWIAGNDSVGTGSSGSQWITNGSNIYYNSGNVGIGTASPTTPLEIVGSATISKYDGSRLILKDTWGAGERPRISFSGDPIAVFDGDTSMGHTFSFMNSFGPARSYDASVQIHGKASNSWGTYLGLTHDGTNGSVLTDVGNLILSPASGKIGIGTTTPNAPLSFPSSLGKKITLYPGASGDVGFGVFSNELRINSDYIGADVTFGYDDYTDGFIERMRIKGNGNVGIGTSDPGGALAIMSSGDYFSPQLLLSQGLGTDWTRIRLTTTRKGVTPRFWDIAGYIGTGVPAEDRLNISNSSGSGTFGVGGNGAVYVNNNAGQPKQVLTSGGSSTPAQWQSVGSIVKTWYAFYDAGIIDVPTMEIYLNSNAEQSLPSLTMTITVDVPSRLIISSQAMFDCECAGFDCSNNITFYLKVDGAKSKNVYFRGEGDEWTTGTMSNILWDVGAGSHTIEIFSKKTYINTQNMHVTGEYASIIAIPN